MKKALSITLALALCAALMSGALIPMTALAANSISIQTDKSNYDPGEKMVITVIGVTQQMIESNHKDGVGYGPCIGIFKKDLSDFTPGEGYMTVREAGEDRFDRYDINAPT